MKSEPILRCWAEIDHQALRKNLSFIRTKIPSKTEVMGMIKANAYGHGAGAVARTLSDGGVKWFGVASLAEGLALKKEGIEGSFLILGAALKEEYEALIQNRFVATVSSLSEGRALNRVAGRLGLKAVIHFKIDTGMGRLGCWWERADQEMRSLLKLSHVEVGGIYTHFACADCDQEMTAEQVRRFLKYQPWFENRIVHLSNSAGFLGKYPVAYDCVRPGISLYGYATNRRDQKHFNPVMRWKTRITAIHHVAKGRTLSYGATYRVARDSKIAVLAVGYADGYPRLLSNQGEVLIRGERAKIRGRVTMDQILVDVSHLKTITAGEEVVLIGKSGKKEILATELAEKTGTIAYEILCGISERVSRIHLHG